MTNKERNEFLEIMKEEFKRLKKEILVEKNIFDFRTVEEAVAKLPAFRLMLANTRMVLEDRKQGIQEVYKGSGISLERVQKSLSNESELEKIESQIEKLKVRIIKQEIIINRIENALDYIRNDEYYPIIKLKYWDKKSNNVISQELNISIDTIKRQKNRLIKEVALIFNQTY